MHALVINRFDPRLKGPVELLQTRWRMILELDHHLLADRAEYPLDLPAPLRPARPRVDQPDPEHGARPQKLAGHERAAVIDIYGSRPAARGEPRSQRPRGVQHVLPRRPPIADQQPAVIIDEAEQKRAATVDQRAVQPVPGPQLVALPSLKTARRTPDLPALPRQPSRHEVALDRPRRRRSALPLHDDPVDLRRRPRRLLATQRARQLQQPCRRLARHPPWRRDQPRKPARTIRPNPPIQRRVDTRTQRPSGPRC